MKQTFGGIHDDPRAVIPDAVKSLMTSNQYVDMQILSQNAPRREELSNVETANNVIQSLAPRFLESIAISTEGLYILITQVEVYLRGIASVDDCAYSTITLGYRANPLFIIEQKREFRNQWTEAKIYFGQLKFLVTGCVHGSFNSSDTQAVLGASLGRNIPTNSYWRVYLASDTEAHIRDVRLLRDFTKKASGYKWHYKSKRFHDEGFSSASALNLPLDDIIAAAGSLLLRMMVNNDDKKEELAALLANSKLLEQINFKNPYADGNKTDLMELRLSKGKRLVVNIEMMVLRDLVVDKSLYPEMYKTVLAPRMKAMNNQVIKKKKFVF
ncbi:uncharacterized protein ATC70_003781 [Mucor velutinosus]|uniref:Uncharacterized protein n=1 Tax=Mucor velutinosus TaxID=708070 RepID=A0AAN7D757_9FUNG|nr:hypothetical protein ATC70_003781 [Mucor velutinosus]